MFGLRVTPAMALALLLLFTSCTSERQPSPSVSRASQRVSVEPSKGPPTIAWRQIESKGPTARSDYSIVGNDKGLYLFGGRSKGKPLKDLWFFDLSTSSWKPIEIVGPEARFGHNAVLRGNRMMVFGGQAEGDRFFDDLWFFDTDANVWSKSLSAKSPSRRYGAGGTLVGDAFLISHGFTFKGRFDDTWSFEEDWSEVSPDAKSRPVKRCLHRVAHLGDGRVLLFGGQTNGEPYLGDTWIFDSEAKSWEKKDVAGPKARTLYALASLNGKAYLFGGATKDGPASDLWVYDAAVWSRLTVDGAVPEPRSGIEGAVANGKLFVFGGNGSSGALDDLWELQVG